MKIVLIGYMGSGKSSVAKALSKQLNFDCKDLDSEIEQDEGVTIPALFADKGEIYFRKKEAAVLQQLLDTTSSVVLALGGGTPCYGNIMQQLNQRTDVITVYLNTSLETLTQRLFKEREQRPLIAHLETEDLLNDFIRKHLFERAFYYNQASQKIDANGKSIDEICRAIVALLF